MLIRAGPRDVVAGGVGGGTSSQSRELRGESRYGGKSMRGGLNPVVKLSFRKGRVQTVSVNMRALCTVREFSLPGHMQRSFLVQKGTSILDHLVLFSQMHSFTSTLVIFFMLKVLKF